MQKVLLLFKKIFFTISLPSLLMKSLRFFTRLLVLACFLGVIAVPVGTIFASTTLDFTNNNAPGSTVGPGYTDVLVLDITIPDGTNGAAEDTLLLDNGVSLWSGDTLISMSGTSEFYFDDNISGTWNNGTEAIWVDANTDSMIQSSEIQEYGTADLETFQPVGGATQGEVFFDVNGNGDFDSGEAVFLDANSDLTLGPADDVAVGLPPGAMLRDGGANVINFDSPAAAASCGGGVGGCHGDAGINDIMFCDGVGGPADGLYTVGESIFIDMVLSPTTADYDPTVDYMIADYGTIYPGATSCTAAGGTPSSLTTPSGANIHPVAFLDANGDGLYDTNGAGPLPIPPVVSGLPFEPVVNLSVPVADGAPLIASGPGANYAGFVNLTPDVSVAFPEWDPAGMNTVPMVLSHSGNLRFIGLTPGFGNDLYQVEAVVNDANTDGILDPGEWVADDAGTRGGPGQVTVGFGATIAHSGAGLFDGSESIYDESTGSTALTLEKKADQLTGLGVVNGPGTAVDPTDIANVQLWADGASAGFDGDEVNLGSMTRHSTFQDEWRLSGLTQAVNAGGQRIFVTADITGAPTNNATMQFVLPPYNDVGTDNVANSDGDLGLFMASTNDGPTDGPLMNSATQTIDSDAPSVSGVTPNDTLLTDADAGADNFYVDIDYDETMDPASTPIVAFTPDIVSSGTLTLSASSGWQDGDTYRAYYDVADVNEAQTLTAINITAATDAVGNTQNAYSGGGESIEVDTVNPTVLSITPDATILTDADVGAGALDVVVVYDDTMDATGANDPTIAFTSPVPSGLSFASDGWSTTTVTNDTYTASYDLADSDEESLNIDIGVTLAQDPNGNVQVAGSASDALNIDTENPTVTAVTPSDTLLSDVDTGVGAFTLDIDFSEGMWAASTPTISFTPDVEASGSLTLNAGLSTWTDADTYRAVYDFADVNEDQTLTDIDISGASDNYANGNVQVVYNGGGEGIQVNTVNPVVTVVQPADSGTNRMASPLIVTTDVNANCTYDLDLAGAVAVTNTGTTIHTDVLTGLAAASHTVDLSCTDVVTLNVGIATSTWTKEDPGNMVLFGIDGAGAADGELWTIDPETGSKVTDIGSVGTYRVTGMALDPVSGKMYASTGNADPGNDSERSLLEIDVLTGAGTYLGKLNDGGQDHNLADISFDSTGQLYGWSENGDDLYAVDISSCDGTTCSVTLTGASPLGTAGSGMAFDSTDNLFFLGDGDGGDMYTLNTADGQVLTTTPLLNGAGGLYFGASAFDSTDMYFAARANPIGPPSPPADLAIIDVGTGIIASTGIIADMNLMNAIEFYEDVVGPTIVITAPTKSSSSTITNTTVTVTDAGGVTAANVTATGGTLNCVQTDARQVDCTSVISTSGSLAVTATDDIGNVSNLTEAGYTISAGGGGGSAGGSSIVYSPSTTVDSTTETTEDEDATDEESTEEDASADDQESSEETDSQSAFSDMEGHWGSDYVNQIYSEGYIEGYEDGTFRPDQIITRSEASKLIALWLNSNAAEEDCDASLFSDVDCADWYGSYVTYLYLQGVIEGYDNGTFGPALDISRAEALKILIFAKELQDTDLSDVLNPFSDVNATDWFYNVVMVGYKLSIVEGYDDGTFGPNKPVTRAEFTKMFVETLLNN